MPVARHGFVFRNRYFLFLDVFIFVLAALGSFAIRLETLTFSSLILYGIIWYLCMGVPIRLVLFLVHGMYSRYWKNAGPSELLLVGSACLTSGFAILVTSFVAALIPNERMLVPRSIPVIDLLLVMILVSASRFGPRAWHHLQKGHRHLNGNTPNAYKRALILGAGQTGVQVLEALGREASPIRPIGFLDDDAAKVGTFVRGYKVFGNRAQLGAVVEGAQIDLVIIAMPSAPGKVIREIVLECQEIGIEYQIVPGLYEMVTGRISVSSLRAIEIDDLLRRTPIKLDVGDIQRQLRGRCVMVTGAGGSIGSELSLQIARCKPSKLLLLGHGENSLFAIEEKIKSEFPAIQYEVVLADIQNLQRLEMIFERWHPHVVFHAAAHKHVPMLEFNVSAAIANNVLGTRNVVTVCNRYNVERMILISTDKAVHPTNVLGLTKRTAEMLVMAAAQEQPGRFAVVRFGNVLGSRGSVVPIFQQQIAAGGPVTITSANMTRFFMSVPEAVLLVLKASVLTDYGPLFVLNMGEPVRVVQLAEDLIRLSGLEPGRDIEIKETGPRPGEKLSEELFWDYESYEAVEQGSIFALRLPPEQLNRITHGITERIHELAQVSLQRDERETKALLRDIVYIASLDDKSAEKALEKIIAHSNDHEIAIAARTAQKLTGAA